MSHISAQSAGRQISPLMIFLSAATAAVTGLYAELFHEAVVADRTGVVTGFLAGAISASSLVHLLLFSLAAFMLFFLLLRTQLFEHIVRWRYPIAVVILIACVALNISGSSVAQWGRFLGEEGYQGTLLGLPRPIRSDEWDVMTPFAFSQAASGFNAASPVLVGGGTDVTMVYGQPSYAVATLFRPFLWGYLLLGAERGLAFFWDARMLCMMLVGFEFFRLLSKDDGLCALGSLMCTLSPATQWWFAVNGTAELLIFGEGLVLTLHSLLNAETGRGRWGMSAILAWLCGSYLLILYPAWQVPFFWIFLALGIWVCVEWAKRTDGDKRHKQMRSICTPLIVCVAAVVLLLAYVLWYSKDTVAAVMGSVYPGARNERGGGLLQLLPELTTSIAGPITSASFANVCESATYLALAPLGAILAVKNGLVRKRDGITLALLVPYAVLLWYGFFGFPEILAKLTLLNELPTYRIALPLGFLDAALLVRGVELGAHDKEISETGTCKAVSLWKAAIPAFLLAMLYAMAGRLANPQAMRLSIGVVLFVAIFCLAAVLLALEAGNHAAINGVAALVMAVPPLLPGAFVNPVQQGAQALEENVPAQLAQQVSMDEGEGVWATDSYVLSQDLVAHGLSTINNVNTYPHMSLWGKIDPDGQYQDAYNRYAHIEVGAASSTSFEVMQSDLIMVHLTADDLKTLGCTYWLATGDVSQANTETAHLEKVAAEGPYTVWKVVSAS